MALPYDSRAFSFGRPQGPFKFCAVTFVPPTRRQTGYAASAPSLGVTHIKAKLGPCVRGRFLWPAGACFARFLSVPWGLTSPSVSLMFAPVGHATTFTCCSYCQGGEAGTLASVALVVDNLCEQPKGKFHAITCDHCTGGCSAHLDRYCRSTSTLNACAHLNGVLSDSTLPSTNVPGRCRSPTICPRAMTQSGLPPPRLPEKIRHAPWRTRGFRG